LKTARPRTKSHNNFGRETAAEQKRHQPLQKVCRDDAEVTIGLNHGEIGGCIRSIPQKIYGGAILPSLKYGWLTGHNRHT